MTTLQPTENAEMMISREQIMAQLQRVPGAAARISGVVIRSTAHGATVGFSIEATGDMERDEQLRLACEEAAYTLPGVDKVMAVLTAEYSAGGSAATPPQRVPMRPQVKSGTHLPPEQRRPAVWNTTPLPHVGHIIAVASGKGGVGKSTTTVNLAHALILAGKRVGILDADIYGPSIPRMLHIAGQPEVDGNLLVPVQAHGMCCMSMGLIAGDDKPVVWRGAMVTKALSQMLRGVRWGTQDAPLDVLLVDMPPGTGDIHLSLAQSVPLFGALIVSTPQDVAVLDAVKCLQMFQKINTPILGVIENMSYFVDPVSGNRSAIFGEGGAKRAAAKHVVPYLGDVPLDMAIRAAADAGENPFTASDNAAVAPYQAIATQMLAALNGKV